LPLHLFRVLAQTLIVSEKCRQQMHPRKKWQIKRWRNATRAPGWLLKTDVRRAEQVA
jgi:hypothetical protein